MADVFMSGVVATAIGARKNHGAMIAFSSLIIAGLGPRDEAKNIRSIQQISKTNYTP